MHTYKNATQRHTHIHTKHTHTNTGTGTVKYGYTFKICIRTEPQKHNWDHNGLLLLFVLWLLFLGRKVIVSIYIITSYDHQIVNSFFSHVFTTMDLLELKVINDDRGGSRTFMGGGGGAQIMCTRARTPIRTSWTRSRKSLTYGRGPGNSKGGGGGMLSLVLSEPYFLRILIQNGI